jgi:hypothetical protein
MDVTNFIEPVYLRVSFERGDGKCPPLLCMGEIDRLINPEGGKMVYRDGRLRCGFFDVFPKGPDQAMQVMAVLSRYSKRTSGDILSVCCYKLTKSIFNRVFRGD